MYAVKTVILQQFLKISVTRNQHLLTILKDELGIVRAGFYTDNLFDLDELSPSLVGMAIWSSWLLGLARLFFSRFARSRVFFKLKFPSLSTVAGGLRLQRLNEIVECADAMALDGIVVISGNKNNFKIDFRKLFKHFKSTHPGHFHIQEDHIGFV